MASPTPSIALLAAAIGLCRPTLSAPVRTAYATVLATKAPALGVDPLLIVALIDHESHWLATAISKDHEDFGLGQIRARFIPKRERKKLLNGFFNLTKTLQIVEWWRLVCKAKVPGSKAAETMTAWLEGYAGRSRPKQGQWCGIQVATGAALPPLKSTQWILGRQAQLAALLASSAKGPP